MDFPIDIHVNAFNSLMSHDLASKAKFQIRKKKNVDVIYENYFFPVFCRRKTLISFFRPWIHLVNDWRKLMDESQCLPIPEKKKEFETTNCSPVKIYWNGIFDQQFTLNFSYLRLYWSINFIKIVMMPCFPCWYLKLSNQHHHHHHHMLLYRFINKKLVAT